jgi:hypothetical protein
LEKDIRRVEARGKKNTYCQLFSPVGAKEPIKEHKEDKESGDVKGE